MQRLQGTTKKQQGAEQELGIDPVMAFYRECSDRAGVELKDWLDSEPF